MKVSRIYNFNKYAYNHPGVEIIVNEGGSRSTKTYSITQLLITIALESEQNLIIDIARKTKEELRDSVYSDFLEILTDNDLYDSNYHNKTRLQYRINNTLFRFIGLDKPQKKRGPKRDILYINEANGLTLEDWLQLNMRASGKVFIDYNPSEEFWVHSHVLHRERTAFIHSNYKDNPFLPPRQIREIEALIEIDPYYYQVYALGKPADPQGKILTNFNPFKDIISDAEYDAIPSRDVFAGFDDGFSNDPMAMVEMKLFEGVVYVKELFYDTGKFVDKDLIPHLESIGFNKLTQIYADPSAARSIAQLQMAGYVVMKTSNDIEEGVKTMKSLKYKVTQGSKNWQREARLWKFILNTKTGKYINRPEDLNNHLMDGTRYGVFNHYTIKYFLNR